MTGEGSRNKFSDLLKVTRLTEVAEPGLEPQPDPQALALSYVIKPILIPFRFPYNLHNLMRDGRHSSHL